MYNAHFSQCALAVPLFASLGPVQKVMEPGLVLVLEKVKFRKSKYNGEMEAILPNAGALVYDWTKEVETKYAKDYEMFKKRRAVYVEENLDSLGGVPIGYESVPDISNVLQDRTNLKLVREPVDSFTIKQEPVDEHENNLIAFSSLDPVDDATSVERPCFTSSQIPDTSYKRTHSGSTTDVDLPDAPVPKRIRTQFIAKGRILSVDSDPARRRVRARRVGQVCSGIRTTREMDNSVVSFLKVLDLNISITDPLQVTKLSCFRSRYVYKTVTTIHHRFPKRKDADEFLGFSAARYVFLNDSFLFIY